MSRALAFLTADRPLDYGARLARLRWRRAAGAGRAEAWAPAGLAGEALAGAAEWLLVADPEALPAFAGPLEASPGKVLAAEAAVPQSPPFVHSLRELEGARLGVAAVQDGRAPAAILIRAADFPAQAGETVTQYADRLLGGSVPRVASRAFRVVRLDEASDRERPELTRRLPDGPLRILDVGCGAGAGIAGARARRPAWTVTGIEWDPALAARARSRCDRVLEGDLGRVLPELAAAGDRFDAIVFADVLEHVDDPAAALSAGRSVAAPGARLLVSVPNVGHLSIARDLVLGRFDPIPAGLTDARHLRWFTRTFLAEALAESGWREAAIESEKGAPAPGPEAFLALAAEWPDCDRESLATYQWVATATNREP